MLLSIFLVLLSLSLLVLLLGYYQDVGSLVVVAYVFLLVLGVTLATGVEYKSGSLLTESGSTTTITDVYTSYANKTFGYFFSVVFGFALVATFLDYRHKN